MYPFDYQRAGDAADAIRAIASHGSGEARFLAGGTNLIDLMKNDVERPQRLVDINHLPLSAITPLPNGGLRLGALARNSDTANHPLVRRQYPLLSQAILAGASPQLRNMASNGGNLLQRTRCYYFMDPAFPRCNKRAPGSGCGALEGVNRIHSILGASAQCIATHPSDMCVALLALDAAVQIQGANGQRSLAMRDFHRLPGNTPQLDTNLAPGELITAIDLPPSPYATHYHYVKVRDRASYAFALVSVAAALELEAGQIRSARIALGGVAHKPWRAEGAERTLVRNAPTPGLFERAAAEALLNARAYAHNQFKIEMAKRSVVRALTLAAERA